MKFNFKTKGQNKTGNYEGGAAYRLSPEWNLYVAAVTSSLSDKFYETAGERVETLRSLAAKCNPEFTAKLAVYARSQMNLRSMPLVLAVELSKIHHGDAIVCKTVTQIVQRVDEITELLAYYQLANERKETKKLNRLSKQIQAGLRNAFNKFDEYQFAKYNRDAAIKLHDALFLVHPKAKDENQQAVFNKIVENKLETPYTWETELSALGQTKFASDEEKSAAFRNKWEELIDSGKLGYMALLRNLRNILDAQLPKEYIGKVCGRLSDEKAVLHSKQLPFRFLAAYRELSKVNSGFAPQIMDALEKAVTVSAANIAGFDAQTKVLVACDVSGSMRCNISPKSSVMNYDIGLMLGMLLKSRCKNIISGIFGDKWKVVNLPNTGVLSNVDAFYKREGEVGYSTNGYLVIQDLIDRKMAMDKIMIFTDCQLWNSKRDGQSMQKAWNKYKDLYPDAKLYLFDLAGYGNTPLDISNKDVYLLAGWSDKVFDLLSAVDNGSNALQEINAIVL